MDAKDLEIFMFAQFIDVIEVLDSYEKIEDIKEDLKRRKQIYQDYIINMDNNENYLSLSINDKSIDDKIEKCKNIYTTNKEYKMT